MFATILTPTTPRIGLWAVDPVVALGSPHRLCFRAAIELTSKGTKTEDQETKPAIYARMGIEYLFLYDVLGEYLEPPLQGMRLGRDGQPSIAMFTSLPTALMCTS